MAHLLMPLKVNGMQLRNRIVLPPMASEKATEDGEVTSGLIGHYRRYAEAGVGLIITEHAYIEPRGKCSRRQLSAADDSKIPGLRLLAEAIHQAGGIAGVQINHCGMAGRAELVGQPVGPSALCHPRREEGEPARELTKDEIGELIQTFARAAGRVKRAGFDMVEIHSAHGYLVNQFNSPLSNHRTDEYGGGLEKRFTFAREVVKAVRKEVGPNFCILFRLGADDLTDGGLTLEDSKRMAPGLAEAGVDLLDLSGGFGGYRAEGEQGYFAYMTEGLKRVVDIPLLTTGGITLPEAADRILAEGRADLVGIGRAMLEDDDWAAKAIAHLSR